jgi:phosphoribosyl 1,2-cyclic phosphodiesterase
MSLEFCSLASGSNGNAQYIATKNTGIILDAGLSGKYIETKLETIDKTFDAIDALLVTHEHSDHIHGVGVLMRRYNVPLYVNHKTWEAMQDKIGKIDLDLVNLIDSDQPFNIKDLVITPYSISHDACDPLGFTFEDDQSKIAIATDLGYAPQEIIDQIKDTDLLFIESNHDVEMLKSGRYPHFLKRRVLSIDGHLSNDDAAEVVKEVVKFGRVKQVLLAHLSGENNFPELAFETVKTTLAKSNIVVGEDVALDMTYRKNISKHYKLSEW